MKRPSPNNPSSIFFWKDYENDEGLRVSSLAAQGLWMRLLCVAAKSDPYGYVVINGCEIGVTGVARLGSVTETEAATLLDELERNGVFSRDRKGRIFSRRMVKEAATRKKNRENGKKGGNPALNSSSGKDKEKDTSDNPPLNHPHKPPYPIPTSPSSLRSEEGGGGGAGEAEVLPPTPPTFRERMLVAMGVDPSGITGRGGQTLGLSADMAFAKRWLELPGITEDLVIEEIQRVMQRKRDGPPSTFEYFDKPMSRLSGALTAPPLEPSQAVQTAGARNDRARFDIAHREYVRLLAAGEIKRGPDPGDPFGGR